jgi:hypothetical protein
MILYYIKIIILLLLNNIFIATILISLGLVIYLRFIFNKNRSYFIKIEDWHLTDTYIDIAIIIAYFIFYLGLFMYWRINNIGKDVDLKMPLYNSYFYYLNSSYIKIIVIILIITLMLLVITITFSYLRKYFFYHFLKIHVYLITLDKTKLDFFSMSTYDKIQFKFLKLHAKITSFDSQLHKIFFKIYKKYNSSYKEEFIIFSVNLNAKFNLYTHFDYLPRYLFLFCIIYDVLINNMVLTKIYYISPLIFIYYIFKKTFDIISFFEKSEAVEIYEFTSKNRKIENAEVIIFEDNTSLRLIEIENINNKLLKAFVLEKSNNNHKKPLNLKILFFTLNILLIIYISKHVQVIFYLNYLQRFIEIKTLLIVVIIFLLTFCLIYNNKLLNKYLFNIMTIIIIIFGFIIIINHKVPLLYNEILLETSYIKIIANYTINEKLIFIKEYFNLKSKHLNINDKIYLFKIFRNIPFYDLLQNSTIDEIKNYIDNLIITYEYIENLYPSLKDNLQNQYNIENQKEETINNISTCILIISILTIYYIYKL